MYLTKREMSVDIQNIKIFKLKFISESVTIAVLSNVSITVSNSLLYATFFVIN